MLHLSQVVTSCIKANIEPIQALLIRVADKIVLCLQVVEAFNTQFRLRLVAALKMEFKRLRGGTQGVTSISTARLGEEEGITSAIAEAADEGTGRAARKSEKVSWTPRFAFFLGLAPHAALLPASHPAFLLLRPFLLHSSRKYCQDGLPDITE